MRESHFTHALDFSFRQGGNIPPIWARSGGRQTRVVGITTTDEFQAVIALPSSGIATEPISGVAEWVCHAPPPERLTSNALHR